MYVLSFATVLAVWLDEAEAAKEEKSRTGRAAMVY